MRLKKWNKTKWKPVQILSHRGFMALTVFLSTLVNGLYPSACSQETLPTATCEMSEPDDIMPQTM